MKLHNYITYAQNKARSSGIKKENNNIQKIMYLSLDENQRVKLFKPYLAGPFSERVQLVNKSLERNDANLNSIIENNEIDSIFKNIDLVVDFLVSNNLKDDNDIDSLSKVHMFVSELHNTASDDSTEDQVSFIKSRSKYLGWNELYNSNNEEIKNLKDTAEKLEHLLNN